MELMFFEKNKFFQRVGWCSGRNHFYRNSEGVSRNLLQEFAELVARSGRTCIRIPDPPIGKNAAFWNRTFVFWKCAFKLLERTPVFQAETSASGLKQLKGRILQPERPSTRGLRSGCNIWRIFQPNPKEDIADSLVLTHLGFNRSVCKRYIRCGDTLYTKVSHII